MIPDGSFDYFGTCLALLLVFPVIFDFRRRAQLIFKQKIRAQLEERMTKRQSELAQLNRNPESGNQMESRARIFRDNVESELKRQGISLHTFLMSTTFATCALFVFSLIAFMLHVTNTMPINLNLYQIAFEENYPFSESYTYFSDVFVLPLLMSLVIGHILIWFVTRKYYEQVGVLSDTTNEKLSETTRPLIKSAINRQVMHAWNFTLIVAALYPFTAPFFVFYFLTLICFAGATVYTTYRTYIKTTINAMFD